jgi:hypothetical protein
MNYSGEGYSLIISTFEITTEGKRIYDNSQVYIDKTYDECITLINEL